MLIPLRPQLEYPSWIQPEQGCPKSSGVGNGEMLHVEYDNITTGLKSADGTSVGDFNQEFVVQLSPDFDMANMTRWT